MREPTVRKKLEAVATVAVIIAAVLVAAVAVRSLLVSPRPGGSITPAPLERVSDSVWEEVLSVGILLGDTVGSPPVTVVEFSDLECPFCRESHFAIEEAQRALADTVAHVMVHYPLDFHRFAIPAARATECAGLESRFGDYLAVVFQKQDSLGLKSWVSYAVESGIQDTISFKNCNSAHGSPASVQRGLETGRRVPVSVTPTVLVNGWVLPSPPRDADGYIALIRRVAKGEEPYGR